MAGRGTSFGCPGIFRLPAARPDRAQLFQILAETLVRNRTILQAREMAREFGGGFLRQRVDHPRPLAPVFDHPPLTEIREMLRHPRLRDPQHRLQMAHAQRAARQELDDPQTRLIAQAFVDSNKGHARNIFG